MIYEWDEGKRAANLARHGINFTAAEDFAWDIMANFAKNKIGD